MKNIVLISGAIGGAEKRFADIFRAQLDCGFDARMILSSLLAELLFTPEERRKYAHRLVIIPLKKWKPLLFLLKFYKWIVFHSDKNDVFHYPLNPPFFLHFFPKRKFTISLCDSTRYSSPPFKSRHDAVDYFAMKFASKIDVLSPHVYDRVMELSAVREKVSLTPQGTFVYTDSAVRMPETSRNISFFGRLDNGKGVELFFQVVEAFADTDFFRSGEWSFKVYGDGVLRNFVAQQVERLTRKGARVTWEGYKPAELVLRESQIVCSLQQATNYPSRVVAESALYGRDVLVVKTGNSTLFGDLSNIHYTDNSVEGVCAGIRKIISGLDARNTGFYESVTHAARERFCDSKYIHYFWEL